MKHNALILLLLLVLPTMVLGQTNTDEQLAAQYFKNGEFEKASVYYEKLFKHYHDEFYFEYYIDCLLKQEKFTDARKTVEKRLKKESDPLLYVYLGRVYKTAGDRARSARAFEKAIQQLPPVQRQIDRLAQAFSDRDELDMALKTYRAGRRLLNGLYAYHFEMADIYERKGSTDLMFEELINAVNEDRSVINKVKAQLSEVLADDPSGKKSAYLEQVLISRIQAQPQPIVYPELLIWHYEQQKQFAKALRQAKAIDRRNHEDGARIVQLGHISSANGNFDVAIEAYEHVLKKGKEGYYYISCRKDLVNALYEKMVDGGSYSEQDIVRLEQTFLTTLDELGRNGNAARIMMNLAELYTYYLHQPQKGIRTLYQVLALPGIDRKELAMAKVQLADALLFTGEVWESTLLYSQAEKMFKNDDIGRMAKLKNAKLAYYTGQFKWAEAQLNVLKAATSDLIANDALYLAMLIGDNSYMDTTFAALRIFAHADLLLYQNKADSAKMLFDSIEKQYPGNSLIDDILYKRGEIAEKEKDYVLADSLYHRVWKEYPQDLLADDAVYRLARINDNELHDRDTAMEYYQELLLNYQGSLYTVEARKRYRALRGDLLN